MKIVEGRSDDRLTTLNGQFVYCSSFFYNLFGHMEGVQQFKVIQDKRDKLSVLLVAKDRFSITDATLEKAKKEIQISFGGGMHVDFRVTEKIERDPNGKLKVFESRVSKSQ
jgi:phenylacetate-coenzyme A ligase PaaK-like adenylate-forming protein